MKKLRHKGTGEIISSKELFTDEFIEDLFSKNFNYFRSKLEKILDMYEVYEEKSFWYIYAGHVFEGRDNDLEWMFKATGNHFETEEEAWKAVEKLKAWKRLKGGGFEFMSCSYGHDKTTDDTGGWIRFRVNHLYDERYGCEVEKDLDLLFGGEDE